MSTSVLGMQPLGAHTSSFDFEFDPMSKNSSMFNAGERWSASQGDSAAYKGFPVPNARPSDRNYPLQPSFQQPALNENAFHNKSSLESFNDFNPQSTRHGTLGVSTAGLQPAMFTASNHFDPATVSPMNTHFDVDNASPSSNVQTSFDGQMHQPLTFATFANENDPLSTKGRCDSLQSSFGSQSPTMPQTQVGRRRGSEYAEPGSARAVYLEKNRKAASKCRSKQKRQQEELVETARHVERQNKMLKAEVDMLKSDMRGLMELVGQHSDCPDTRLKRYVQREADRLVTGGGTRNALPSPFSSSPYLGPSPTGKISSPEDE
jgi:hypothetical protein